MFFMARAPRIDIGDIVYHAINRSNGRATIFHKPSDYQLFEELLQDSVLVRDMRILAYCIMPNHWHILLYPHHDGHMGEVLQWLLTTHTRRWHRDQRTVGGGHLYQGRYKSFPVETDTYLLQVIRYIERNPLRAHLVQRAEDWPYSSLYHRQHNTGDWLADTIVPLPKDYLTWVNEPEGDLADIRRSVNTGMPFGDDVWAAMTRDEAQRRRKTGL